MKEAFHQPKSGNYVRFSSFSFLAFFLTLTGANWHASILKKTNIPTLSNDIFLNSIGSDVVLGPPHNVIMERTDKGVPIEQAISRQRLRPGSGTLCVRVTTDGPTRVLQILDVNKSNVSIVH